MGLMNRKTVSILMFSWLGLARLFSANDIARQNVETSVTTENRRLNRSVAARAADHSEQNRSTETASLWALLRRSQELVNTGASREGKHLADEILNRAKADLEVTREPSVNFYIMGVASLILDQDNAATEFLEKSVELGPNWPPARIALAKAYFKAGEPDRGLNCLRRGLADFPTDASVKRALAEALFSARVYDEAIRLFEELAIASPGDERIFNSLLRLYKATGDVEKAEAGFKRLLDKGEIARIDYLLQLSDLHRQRGDLREMGRLLQEARREQADHPGVAERFRHYYEAFADRALEEGQPARGIIYLRRALEFAPDDPAILYRIARLHAQNGEHAKAMECYQAVLKTNPDDPQFYVDFANTLLAVNRLDVAVAMYERLIESARSRGKQDEETRFRQAHTDLLQRAEAMRRALPSSLENK